MTDAPSPSPATPRRGSGGSDNPWVSIVFNVVIPVLILTKLSKPDRLGPVVSLLGALAFPLGYGAWDYAKTRRTNLVSALGFVSVALTGGFGLLKLSGIWFAVKEAAVPLVIAVGVVVSLRTKTPLVRTMLYNDKIIDVARVNQELTTRGTTGEFERLLVATTWLLSASFLLSSALNFGLAIYILKSPSGTPEFNAELGSMAALSYPVIVVPCMFVTFLALWRLLAGIRKLTGLDVEAIFKSGHDGKAPDVGATKG